MKKRLAILFVLALAMSILPSCKTAAPAAKEPIIIGGITDLSGNGSVLGNAVNKGWELAVADINAKGGVNGRQLKLITYDCKSDPQEAITLHSPTSVLLLRP
jgi:branched-chain amino acid transport system substrate-binding protein